MRKTTFMSIFMASMIMFAGTAFTACGDDDETQDTVAPGGGDEDGQETEVVLEYADVTYTASAVDLASLQAVAGELYVRYTGDDGAVHQEAFNGAWEKTVRVPSADSTCTIAAQVVGVPKDSTGLASLVADINLNVDIAAEYALVYSNGESSVHRSVEGGHGYFKAEDEYSLPDDFTAFYDVVKSQSERYGGYVFKQLSRHDNGVVTGDNASVFWAKNVLE